MDFVTTEFTEDTEVFTSFTLIYTLRAIFLTRR